MTQKKIVSVLMIALVMLGLPWAAVTFIKGDGGMAACFLLFFAINPLCSLIVGLFAGKQFSVSWFQPLLCACFFVFGTWVLFDMSERAFLIYALIYLLIGYASAAVSRCIYQHRRTIKGA